jgi:hypothetical protein
MPRPWTWIQKTVRESEDAVSPEPDVEFCNPDNANAIPMPIATAMPTPIATYLALLPIFPTLNHDLVG